MTVLDPSLDQIRAMMRTHGARRLLLKPLASNDNSKNQVYLGGDLSIANVIPAGTPVAAVSGDDAKPIFKAPLTFFWIDGDGQAFLAPGAQLILYPQYPEVRMSGVLTRAAWSPRDVVTSRDKGRVLLLGICADGRVLAYGADAASAVANELRARTNDEMIGVFYIIPLEHGARGMDSRLKLLSELCRVSRSGWIDGWRLGVDGSRRPCVAPNCGGVTLESELGITANGRSEPDFDGWEVKSHSVAELRSAGSGAITLMTPEPSGGFYVAEGVIAFVRRFGYIDKRGREDRLNFGGVHRVGMLCTATGLSLELNGYDRESKKLTQSDGALRLVDPNGVVAASWTLAGLLAHWTRKHSGAVYVPTLKRSSPSVAYQYGQRVLLAEGTDYLRLLNALADGVVYYDPGIKIEQSSSGRPTWKKRSQFRISRKNIATLYHSSAYHESCSYATIPRNTLDRGQ